MLNVTKIRLAYEQQVGKAEAPSTIYCLLERHDWRQAII